MPMVTPTLNLPQPTVPPKAAAPAPAPVATPAAAPAARPADVPSATVTLSPQALSAMAAANHPSSTPSTTSPGAAPAAPTPAAHDGSVYESLKSGIATAVADVGDAIAGGAHAVVDGVETTLSTANKVAKGLLELPFAAVAKACDAAGAVIDEL